MSEINWSTTKEDDSAIQKIVKRYHTSAAEPVDPLSLTMDIAACHLNGTPLDLVKLLRFNDADFGHDVSWIIHHMERTTGKLKGHFLPRCAR